jgi:3-hydroxybutyrate dehydrogenase
MAQSEEIERLVAETIEALGQVDLLVNNAGIQHVAPITAFPEARWRQIIEIMLTAPFLLTRAVLPGMDGRVQVGAHRQHRVCACITGIRL